MEAIFPDAASLAEYFGGANWDRLFIREDCSEGNWKVRIHLTAPPAVHAHPDSFA
jgi:hypothetical protein